ncbi:hypothetical protein ACFQZS_05760 [Mucilaginibacter calamicampi]|uniref:Uncharacterized protein n=1 Tax=Mucilaginibacter calamicampi TaxID=1302352 RepID=A0ABW2YUI4_9SPHI
MSWISTVPIRVKPKYRNLFIVENRNLWDLCEAQCDKAADLVLCVDFALKQELLLKGYEVEFLDHLVQESFLEQLNFTMHDFLNNWFKDENGQDLLLYKNYSLGDSLLLYLINDVTFFCHFFFNIIGLKSISYERIIVAATEPIIIECLDKAEINYDTIKIAIPLPEKPVYLFPITKWVKEKTENSISLKFKLKNIIANAFDLVFDGLDRTFNKNKKRIYIQQYHCTQQLINTLKQNSDVQIVTQNYTGISHILKERRVHFSYNEKNNRVFSDLFNKYQNSKKQKWTFMGYPIDSYIYERIDKTVYDKLKEAISAADDIETYFKKYKLQVMVPVTNYWVQNRLLMNYCRNNSVPIYMIINGLLNISYMHDAKDSDYVNSYSVSIKEEYFNNRANVFALGDPRMDKYTVLEHKRIDRNIPLIVIGTAGYDSIDLNSYLAYEFDFLYDILVTLNLIKTQGLNFKIVLKVRANGYTDVYKKFVNEYFDHLPVEIIQDKSFFDVITNADLYISIFSQTIFEASCLGIPAIYYKKDTQYIHKPFNNKSQLVTANNVAELQEKILGFYNNDAMYSNFLKKEIMEEYIGPLDGNNLKRNIDFVHNLINQNINKA